MAFRFTVMMHMAMYFLNSLDDTSSCMPNKTLLLGQYTAEGHGHMSDYSSATRYYRCLGTQQHKILQILVEQTCSPTCMRWLHKSKARCLCDRALLNFTCFTSWDLMYSTKLRGCSSASKLRCPFRSKWSHFQITKVPQPECNHSP